MKKKVLLCGMVFILGLLALGCGGDEGGAGSGINGQIPASFPSDWRSISATDWEAWSQNIDVTPEQEEEMMKFIRNNYDLLSEGGKAFWRFVFPEDTHGIDVSGWPTDQYLNSFNLGSSLYFRKSEDGLALAANPMGRGNGGGIYEPDIFILQAGTGGTFPVGVWLNRNEETLTFNAGTVAFDRRYEYNIRLADYTMSADTFVLSNFTTIPYAPTADDLAQLATYNEASFRSSHPWIPATSTITPKVKKGHWFYDIVDNPVVEPFVFDPDAIGIWMAHDYVAGDKVSSYIPPAVGNVRGGYSGIQLLADGTVKVQNRYAPDPTAWNNLGEWTASEGTYTGGKISGNIACGIIDNPSGDNTAPEFAVNDYGALGVFLFVQNKTGDYSHSAQEPWYEVFKKQ